MPQGKRKVELLGRRHSTRMSPGIGGNHYKQVSPQGTLMNKILNFERILCPVAQAHESDEGLRYAILIARAYGARLSVLTCNSVDRKSVV